MARALPCFNEEDGSIHESRMLRARE